VPDLPLAGNDGPKFGFGLWNSIPLTFTVELALLGLGLALYLRGGSRNHPVRRGWAVGFAAVLAAAYIATTLGPPPPSVRAIGISAIAMLLTLAAVAGWIDRGRSTRTTR
jgi:peptidoglycan/LPS O-acetylase OafA/YrhL